MQNITTFNTENNYIIIPLFILTEKKLKFRAILDTGAPRTEFSDEALYIAGLFQKPKEDVQLQEGLQTKKYSNITLPKIEICGHEISNLTVYVSHFEKSWGIDALIGLDFFRTFRVTLDFQEGHIITEEYSS